MVNEKAKEIDFGGAFGAAAFKINGIHLEIGADGKSISIVSDTPVSVTGMANIKTPQTSTAIAAAQKALGIGDVAADGWYCIGGKKKIEMSPPVIMTWEQAAYLTWNQDAQKVFLDEVLGDPAFPKDKRDFRLPGNSTAAKEFNRLSDGKLDKFATVNDNALNTGRDQSSLISLPDDATLKQMFCALSDNPKMRAAIAESNVQDLNRTGSYPTGRVWGATHGNSCARVQYSDGGNQNYGIRGHLAEARFARRGLARS